MHMPCYKSQTLLYENSHFVLYYFKSNQSKGLFFTILYIFVHFGTRYAFKKQLIIQS